MNRVLPGVVVAVTVVNLPGYLVATEAVQLRSSLHFGSAEIGFVLAAYYAGSVVLAFAGGIAAEALGGELVLRLVMLVSALALWSIASLVRGWPELALALFFAGGSSATAQAAANLVLARNTASGRQGIAFGVKQSAAPLAYLIGGAAVPAVALTVGWHWAFAGAGVLACLGVLAVPRSQVPGRPKGAQSQVRREPGAGRGLVLQTAGFGLALMSCASLATYLVASGVSVGLGAGAAGVLAAVAGLGSIGIRIGSGWAADRRQMRHFEVVAGMLVVGACGFGLMVTGAALRMEVPFVIGGLLAFAVGWGWNGLFNLGVVLNHPAAPGRATGFAQTGGRLGSMLGPLLFALLLSRGSYAAGWGGAAVAACAGATLMVVGGRRARGGARSAGDHGGGAAGPEAGGLEEAAGNALTRAHGFCARLNLSDRAKPGRLAG